VTGKEPLDVSTPSPTSNSESSGPSVMLGLGVASDGAGAVTTGEASTGAALGRVSAGS
jgi:hypothetical protein